MSWASIMDAAQPHEGGFRCNIPESWLQGRTAYGGLSTALVLNAATRITDGALPPLRSAQIAMIAPVSGPVSVSAREVRRGKNVIWIASELATQSGTAITASFAFQAPRDSRIDIAGYPAPDGIVPLEHAEPLMQGTGPVFLQEQMEVRFAVPPAGDSRAEMCWWVRLKDRRALDPMTELMLIGDTMPPGVMPLLGRGVPASTMHWHCNVLDQNPVTDDGWWLMRSASDHAASGFSSEPLMAWNAKCKPIMASMQSVAIFG